MRPLISLKGAYLIDVVAGGAYSSILLVKKKTKNKDLLLAEVGVLLAEPKRRPRTGQEERGETLWFWK
jgi:hypothetical protein